MKLYDGLVNLVSGMGTGRDKGGRASYAMPVMDEYQALNAYKASSLIRRAIDLPAEDAAREWREWQGEADQISAIEAEENRLGLQAKVMTAMKRARLFGGSAILIGTGDVDTAKPLDPKSVKAGGLRYLTLLSPRDLSAMELEQDPTLPNYQRPKMWSLRGGLQVHPSRIAVFTGTEPMPEYGTDQNTGFGDSVLIGMMDALTRVDEAANNVNSLTYEAKG
ncbi:MAG: DUF1073 domain-containing protein [Cypionkella sp.]|nr:DUF1073 domain-containing protein [Cypionkella sp.]